MSQGNVEEYALELQRKLRSDSYNDLTITSLTRSWLDQKMLVIAAWARSERSGLLTYEMSPDLKVAKTLYLERIRISREARQRLQFRAASGAPRAHDDYPGLGHIGLRRA